MLRNNLRLVTTIVGLVSGVILTIFSLEPIRELLNLAPGQTWASVLVLTLGGLLGALLGFVAAPAALWVEGRLARTDLVDLVLGAIGLIVGLIIASLLALTVGRIAYIGPTLSALGGLVFAYLGISVAARKRGELEKWIAGARFFRHEPKGQPLPAEEAAAAPPETVSPPKILDTSVIIDGRVAEILATGFLEGPIVIPNFVLDELRHIADSSDVLKRNRGRRGLDILNQIQKELGVEVRIYEDDLGENLEVDSKLLKLGKLLNGKVVTNDFNLNKVAELQGVPVLNINELANAVKPAVLPGEEMSVTVVKDGKEAGQGVAYLDDGTMIVVDGGRRFMNETLDVIVTSVLQTAAGRMIFAKPKLERVAP